MTLTNLSKAPFPYFGGKSQAAPAVWAALGDCPHFVDPFCGSLAVLLLRPHKANRPYSSETVNDADGLLTNALRSLQLSPDATADAASWYVSEADLVARQLAIVRWRESRDLEKLMADPSYHDPVIGGWWLWGMSCWIGSGFAAGDGPWVVGADGRITKTTAPRRRDRQGVEDRRPFLANNGRGVNHAGARERGVGRQLPHLANDGQGVNRPQARETGVASPITRHPSPVTQADQACIIPDDLVFHPHTMPEVTRWFHFLSARLRHVRICTGDWRRVVTGGAAFTLPVRGGDGPCGVFLDPPYAASAGRAAGLYARDDLDVAHAAREWAIVHGGDPRFRIVFAGYAGEHGNAFTDAGWRAVEWFTDGWLRGGMANQNANGHQQDRERLWMSPHCRSVQLSDLPMFAGEEDTNAL